MTLLGEVFLPCIWLDEPKLRKLMVWWSSGLLKKPPLNGAPERFNGET